jgi:hypothetical protein
MRHSRKLVDDRRIDPRVPVAMNIAPQAADTIEQTPALRIDQPIPFGSFDQQRLVFGHLRKAMPMMKTIGMCDPIISEFTCHITGLCFISCESAHQASSDLAKGQPPLFYTL